MKKKYGGGLIKACAWLTNICQMNGQSENMNDSSKKVIKALVLDIDGVLTDGTVTVEGLAQKRIFLRDIDALNRIRRSGVRIAFLTGETESEAKALIDRCGGGDFVLYQSKDKEAGIHELARQLKLDVNELCYIADARRDIPAMKLVGLAMCPADGDRLAKQAAHVVLEACGGHGAVSEAVDLILEGCESGGADDR